MGSPEKPRVLMLSTRNSCKLIYRHNGYEFEDVICAVDDVELVAPAADNEVSRLERRVLDRLGRLTGLQLERRVKTPQPTLSGEYELLFVAATDPGDLLRSDLQKWVRAARARCRMAVCYFEELWETWLKHGDMVESLRQFDHIMLGCASSCEAASRLTGKSVTYLSPGLDMVRFCPLPRPPRRAYDVRAMGRRSDATHEALVEWSERQGASYLYDTTIQCPVGDLVNHRRLYAATVRRSRYFLVNPAKINAHEHTEGQEELGLRFSEGAGGGAVLLGQSPKCRSYETNFDWPDAVIEMPYGSTDAPDIIMEMDAQPERLARIRRDNVYHHLRRHDWARRWLEILEASNLAPRQRARDRLARLESLAESLPSDGLVANAAELEVSYINRVARPVLVAMP